MHQVSWSTPLITQNMQVHLYVADNDCGEFLWTRDLIDWYLTAIILRVEWALSPHPPAPVHRLIGISWGVAGTPDFLTTAHPINLKCSPMCVQVLLKGNSSFVCQFISRPICAGVMDTTACDLGANYRCDDSPHTANSLTQVLHLTLMLLVANFAYTK